MPARSPEQELTGWIKWLARCPDLSTFHEALARGGRPVEVEPWMVPALKDAEARVRLLRIAVEHRLAGIGPLCLRCRRPMTGRVDKVFCSARCRQAEHRVQRSQARAQVPVPGRDEEL